MKRKQLQVMKQTLKRYPIRQAYLFGSHARGTAGAMSDIDVALLYDTGVNTDRVESKLFAELSRRLATDNIDLIDIASASPLLAHRSVIRGLPLLRHSRHEEAMLKTRILHAYEDTRHLRDIKQNVFL